MHSKVWNLTNRPFYPDWGFYPTPNHTKILNWVAPVFKKCKKMHSIFFFEKLERFLERFENEKTINTSGSYNFKMSKLHFYFHGTRKKNLTRFKISKFSMNQDRPVRPCRYGPFALFWPYRSRDMSRGIELKKRASNMDIRLQNTNINFT